MLKLLKIAITGGVASGKSTVCRHLQKLGAHVVSADAIVHELLDPKTDLGQEIIRIVGSDIVQNGEINRSNVAKKVFQDPKLLREVETLIHPAVLKKIDQRYAAARREGLRVPFIVEMPLLYEIGAEGDFDAVVTVDADPAIAKERWIASGHSQKEYELRMKRQIPIETKKAKANYTIQNNTTLADLYSQVERLYDFFTSELHRS